MAEPVLLSTLREVLARVFPMEGVIVVGVGRGQGLADFGSAASMLLIDARAECVEALHKQPSDAPNCTAVQAVIAAQTGSAAFHIASKPDESGLIAPEALRPLWRNLTTHRTEEVEASTLPDLVARLELAADFRCSWLVVDCLPALPVLEGAGQLIDQVEVLELRCVRNADIAPGQGASLGSAKHWLEPLGFRLLQEVEESHPELVKAVFCRDLRKLGGRVGLLEQAIAELQASNDENVRVHAKEKVALIAERHGLVKERQTICAERDKLAQAKAAADQLAAERQTQLEALSAERQQLTAARDSLTKEKAALTAERDRLVKEKQTLCAESETLVKFKAAADQLAAERQTQLEALTAERQQLTAARDALTKEKAALMAERDRLVKEKQTLCAESEMLVQSKAAADELAAERQTELKALTAERQQLSEARDALAAAQRALAAERDRLAEENQALAAERDSLAQAKVAAEKLSAERQAKLDALAVEQEKLISVRDSLTQDKTALISERDDLKRQQQKLGGDADIDDFINDIAPFFSGRSIVYVDVGAYTGEVFFKLLATKKIRIREAHLIEPNPESYRQLKEAVKLSNLPSCNTYHIGISNNPGVVKFKAAKSMTKKVAVEIACEDTSSLFETECRRLDEVASLFTDGRVHLMKLDVEGEELDVIRSAERLFKEQKVDVLYVEVGFNRQGTQQTYFGDLDALLQSYGYRVFKIYEQKNEWIDDSPLMRRCNAAYMSGRFESANPYTKTLAKEIS